MPIVDGLTSTKMIRSFEKSHPRGPISERAALNSRIPIFAVSASLIEKEREKYIDAGFDGWILKPIDFPRLSVLLNGIVEEKTRESCLYAPGQWENGGWFTSLPKDIFEASTTPSATAPVTSTEMPSAPPQKDDDPISKEQARLNSLNTDAVHANVVPEKPGKSGNLDAAAIPDAANLPSEGGPKEGEPKDAAALVEAP